MLVHDGPRDRHDVCSSYPAGPFWRCPMDNEFLKSEWNEWYKRRVPRALLLMAAGFALLFVRLFHVQVIQGTEFARMSQNNCIRLQTLPPPRGVIYDRAHVALVENRPSFDLFLVPADARPLGQVVTRLAAYLRVPENDIVVSLQSSDKRSPIKPVLIREDVDRDTLAVLESHRFELPGVSISVRSRRHYLKNNTAAHLVGYLGEVSAEELRSGRYPKNQPGDFVGKFGVEKEWESHLSGRHGGQQVEVDARGRVVRVLQTVHPVPGSNVYLTMDAGLQEKAEALLRDSVGAVVAMDPQSGDILAMVSSPSFDPNQFANGLTRKDWKTLCEDPFRPLENKVIQGEYPPGSVHKIVTALAGLEEKVIDPGKKVFCPGYYQYGDRVFRCWKKWGHGDVDLVGAIAESCDVYFYKVGEELGVDRLAWYAAACGLGTGTGAGIGKEAQGLVPNRAWKRSRMGSAWYGGETLSVAIGQGFNLVTPMQMVSLVSAVANGGDRFKPQVVRRIETSSGETVSQSVPEPVGKLPVSARNLAWIRKGLWEAVNGRKGTARQSRLEGFDLYGKTGTSQVVGRNVRGEFHSEATKVRSHRDHAWFIGYASGGGRSIAAAALVEHGEHGASAAAPIVAEIIRHYLESSHGGAVGGIAGQYPQRRDRGS